LPSFVKSVANLPAAVLASSMNFRRRWQPEMARALTKRAHFAAECNRHEHSSCESVNAGVVRARMGGRNVKATDFTSRLRTLGKGN